MLLLHGLRICINDRLFEVQGIVLHIPLTYVWVHIPGCLGDLQVLYNES